MTPPPVLGSSSYNADFDLDRDGIVSSKDVRFVQDQVGRAAVGDAISDHSITDPSNYSSPPSGPNNILGFAGMVQGRPSTGLLLARHRWLDPKLGRWLTRDPAGYVDGLNLFEYCSSDPSGHVDPMGLANAAVDRSVASNLAYQTSVMQSFKNGEISAQDASRLIDGAMRSTLSDINTAETLSNRWNVKLSAGLKGNANSAIDTVVSLGSLGLVDRIEAFDVNDYERGAGYGQSYFVGRVANEAAFAILTGPKGPFKLGKLGRVVDLGGSIVQTTRGARMLTIAASIGKTLDRSWAG